MVTKSPSVTLIDKGFFQIAGLIPSIADVIGSLSKDFRLSGSKLSSEPCLWCDAKNYNLYIGIDGILEYLPSTVSTADDMSAPDLFFTTTEKTPASSGKTSLIVKLQMPSDDCCITNSDDGLIGVVCLNQKTSGRGFPLILQVN